MKSSVGQETLEDRLDEDGDGIADQAERDFEESSTVQPSPSDGPSPSESRDGTEGGSRSADDETDMHPVLPDGEIGKPIESPVGAAN